MISSPGGMITGLAGRIMVCTSVMTIATIISHLMTRLMCLFMIGSDFRVIALFLCKLYLANRRSTYEEGARQSLFNQGNCIEIESVPFTFAYPSC